MTLDEAWALTAAERFAAEQVLDRPYADPDDDSAILARAALRLADRVYPRESLDDAWRAAEAALPKAGWMAEDGRFEIADGRWSVTLVHVQSGDGYYEPVEEGFKAFATVEPGFTARGDLASDPAAALHALAVALQSQEAGE